MLPIIVTILALTPTGGVTVEPYEEPAWEARNPVRVSDWDTLKFLLATKVKKVTIDADSPEKLIAQLEAVSRGVKGAKNIRFSFNRLLWEQPFTDGTVGKLEVSIKLGPLENVDLLTLIRYVSELNNMTFTIRKNEIMFRPKVV